MPQGNYPSGPPPSCFEVEVLWKDTDTGVFVRAFAPTDRSISTNVLITSAAPRLLKLSSPCRARALVTYEESKCGTPLTKLKAL